MNNETVKLADNELAEVRLIQEKSQQKIYQLGVLYLQKMQAEVNLKSVSEQETKLREEWSNILKMENESIDKLVKKYGEGSIDPVAGTFIPDKKTTS